MKSRFAIVSLMLVLGCIVVGAGCPSKEPVVPSEETNTPGEQTAEETLLVPTIAVSEQNVSRDVAIEHAVVNEPSWVVIHVDENGEPGEVIGYTRIEAGKTENIRVTVQVSDATRTLYAMLHEDKGTLNAYEFPGVDVPTTYRENVVMQSFQALNISANKKFIRPATPTESPAPAKPTPAPVSAASEKIFSMTAKQYEFSPATITVNKGDKVTLNITSVDVEHGFGLAAFGVNADLKPNKTTVVTFTADKAGTFNFLCSVYCGSGHNAMKGTLIVK